MTGREFAVLIYAALVIGLLIGLAGAGSEHRYILSYDRPDGSRATVHIGADADRIVIHSDGEILFDDTIAGGTDISTSGALWFYRNRRP